MHTQRKPSLFLKVKIFQLVFVESALLILPDDIKIDSLDVDGVVSMSSFQD